MSAYDNGRKDPESPATTSLAYDAMCGAWSKINAVLGGTEAMRAAGETLLPRHPEESQSAYDERVGCAVLLNMTELTLNTWVGRPFSDPVKVVEQPAQMDEWLKDIDLQHNNISTFCRNWFRDGVAKAFSHVLVEHPRFDLDTRTALQDLVEQPRPYWVHILPENLIFAEYATIDGKEVLVHVRFCQNSTERVGYAERVVERIRELNLIDVFDDLGNVVGRSVQAILWRKQEKKRANEKDKWAIEADWLMDIDEIPLVTFYADRTGPMTGKSPMADLVDLNIRWWQSNADQINILTVSRFPMLAASGVSSVEDLVASPHIWLGMSAPNGKFYYVEHEGKAIAAGDTDLKNLEEQMAHYGALFLRKRSGQQLATARALDSAEATSPLQDVAIRFENAMNEALRLTAKWADLDPTAQASVVTDYGPEEASTVENQLLMFARKERVISKKRLVKILYNMGLLGDDFDEETNEKELVDEAEDAAEEAAAAQAAASEDSSQQAEDGSQQGDVPNQDNASK